MARLPRLVLPGHAHYVIQRGLAGHAVFQDAKDRADFLATLYEAARAEQVLLHAWALLEGEVQLLATPATTDSLGRMVQAVGRRYVSAHNRRHQRSGTLWSGRFACSVVEAGTWRMAALQLVDGQGGPFSLTSGAHRLGGARDANVVDLPEYWALGNTPFEREAAYRTMLDAGPPPAMANALLRAAVGGWAVGAAGFVEAAAQTASRPARPRNKGRPRRQ